MTPEQMAKELGGFDGDAVLVRVEQHNSPELVRAIRASFEAGNEQGNARRLDALVLLEGEGAIDVLRAVLEDTVVVGGIYSNLRNTALELIQARFLGAPGLEPSLWKAIEIDAHLDIDRLYAVMRPYDATRAAQLAIPAARDGVPAAIGVLAKEPSLRGTLLELLPIALTKGSSEWIVRELGALVSDPEVAAVLAPHADTVPAIADLAIATADVGRLRVLAEKIEHPAWQATAIRALSRMDPAEAFDRASVVFTAPKRTKPAGRYLARCIHESLASFAMPLDPRWLPFLIECLDAEEHAEFRGILVSALGNFGADAVPAILSAPRSDKDKHVLAAIPTAIETIGSGNGVVELVRAAHKTAKGAIKRALTAALTSFDA